eukprot:g31284.t1
MPVSQGLFGMPSMANGLDVKQLLVEVGRSLGDADVKAQRVLSLSDSQRVRMFTEKALDNLQHARELHAQVEDSVANVGIGVPREEQDEREREGGGRGSTIFYIEACSKSSGFRVPLRDYLFYEPGCGPCDQLCRKPHPSLQSIFVAPDRLRAVTAEDGRSATRYVVRSDHEDIEALCSKDLDLCNATLVPYVDALDPLNMSRLEIYVDPILEVQLRWLGKHRAWLCRIDDDVSKECVCQLTGHETHSSVLERFGALLPKTMGLRLKPGRMDGSRSECSRYFAKWAQLNLERRCPEPSILDGLCSTLLFLLLLIGALTLEALLALRHEFSGASRRSGAPDGEEAAAFEWPEDAVKVQSPSQNFFTGLGWSGGFVGCLVTLQTVTLSYVEKTDVPEQVDWAIMFFPCFLAVLGSYRLMKLLCKKQLTHFCLKRGVLLLDPAPSTRIDVMLLALLGLYGLLVLGCSFANPQAMVVVALLGPFWTLLKADVSNAIVNWDGTEHIIEIH